MGETAALRFLKGMRSPASLKRDVNKPLKKPAREPWNERKGFMACGSSVGQNADQYVAKLSCASTKEKTRLRFALIVSKRQVGA